VTALDVGLITNTTPTRRYASGGVIAGQRPFVVALPTCVCGDRGTHRPEPGVGCTRPGCLCLEPGEPSRQVRSGVAAPPNPGRSVRR
jgi:hypothetical protein